MATDFYSERYDGWRQYIKDRRKKRSWSWDETRLMGKSDEASCRTFRQTKVEEDDFIELSDAEWNELIDFLESEEENAEPFVLSSNENTEERYLLRHDLKPEWTGAKKKRIDFTAADEAWEVKSTLRRSELTVTVHGQYQLAADDGKKLNLVFCRLEESAQGESVDMLADNLKNMGIAADALERELKSLGLRAGSVGRNRRFRCLETRVYDVDASFPAITAKSFADGRFPAGIVKLDYTIDLANLPYMNWQDM